MTELQTYYQASSDCFQASVLVLCKRQYLDVPFSEYLAWFSCTLNYCKNKHEAHFSLSPLWSVIESLRSIFPVTTGFPQSQQGPTLQRICKNPYPERCWAPDLDWQCTANQTFPPFSALCWKAARWRHGLYQVQLNKQEINAAGIGSVFPCPDSAARCCWAI